MTTNLPPLPPTDSFVTNILATAGRLEKEDLTTKLTQLSSKIDEVKLEVFEALQKKYVDFHPIFDSTQLLVTRVATVSEEMNTLASSIERQVKGQVRVSSIEYDILLSNYEESKATMQILSRLAEINEALSLLSKAVGGAGGDQQLIIATEQVARLNVSFKMLTESHGNNIKVMPCLRMVYQAEKEKLETYLVDKWIEFIQWTFGNNEDCNDMKKDTTIRDRKGNNDENYKVELLFVGSGDKVVEFAAVTQAMSNLAALDSNIKPFCANLMKHIVRPCLTAPRTFTAVAGKSKFSIGVRDNAVSHSEGMWTTADTLEAFKNLKTILDVLHQSLGGISLTPSSVIEGVEEPSHSSNTGTTKKPLMMYIGETIVDELLKILIDDCLAPSIPINQSELSSYDEVISATKLLESRLLSSHLLTPDVTVLSEYVSNVTSLFVNKKCQQLLERARTLMMSPLHNVVTAGEPNRSKLSPLDLPGETKDGNTVKTDKGFINDERIDKAALARVLNFPVCQISVSVKEFVALAYETLHETTTGLGGSNGAAPISAVKTASSTKTSKNSKSSANTMNTDAGSFLTPPCVIQLFYAVRNIFELYISIVPVYHRERLTSLPLFAAVHHNDCMYIAHHLSVLAHQFRPALPPPLSTGHATFIDLVPVMRRLAVSCLMDQITRQKTDLLELYKAAHGFVGVGDGINNESCEKAVKQSMLQLRHLGTVWRDVLPCSVFTKALGSLLNAIICEIISSIVTLEDISVTDADCLYTLLSIILQAGPEITRQGEELNPEASSSMHKHCAKWNQLSQMMFVLKASLTEIGERWADGKGPLAIEFSAGQMKQLIRALFQNTEKRAAVLMCIR